MHIHYKFIAMELLQNQASLYDHLLANRSLLPALELYASLLEESHHALKESLARQRPGSDLRQLEAEALGIAIKEMETRLSDASLPKDSIPLTLDAAIAFITRLRLAA